MSRLSSAGAHIARYFDLAPYRGLLKQVGWVVVPYGVQQVARLGTNIVLARLLAPEIFGLMLLVNTLRTGAELLSDIGIRQSVVRSPNGDDHRFLNVAWTLQLLRGSILTIIMLATAAPITAWYARPELYPIIVAISPVFLLSGMASPALFVVQRKMKLRKRALFEFGCLVFQCTFSIALAYLWRDVWALVWGLVGSVFVSSAMSFLLEPNMRTRLAWDRSYVGEIFNFGKWIFLSTVVYFAATSYDRLYFVAVLSLSMAGVYGVSRTFSDVLGQLAQRTGSLLVFPRIAAMQVRRAEMAPRLRSRRRHTLALVAIATGFGVACADRFILLAYDWRYQSAAFMVPVLLVTTWFSVLSAFADSMLMGCGRPAPGARANMAKFLVLLVGLPIAVSQGSMLEGLIVLLLAEMARWLALIPPSRKEQFMKASDDLQLTAFMLVTAVVVKFTVGLTGLVPTLDEWWALHRLLSL
jgi:O-antigen/teichoic acid export membrane protein